MSKIVAIIVTYNINNKIKEVYKSVVNQVDKIIFVDNGSNYETIKLLKEIDSYSEKVDIIYNKSNLGIAKALNLGVIEALKLNFDFIMTLDHDSILKENMVRDMRNIYNLFKDKEYIGIISPAIYDINKNDYLTNINKEKFQFITEPIQSGSIIKSDLFKNVGLFNEDLIIYYVDTEFCYRASQKGYKFLQCNNTYLYHEEGKKTCFKILGKNIYYQNYSEFALYYRARNYVYMMKNHYDKFSSKDRIFKDGIKILIFDKTRIKSIKAHIKGIYDGMKRFMY